MSRFSTLNENKMASRICNRGDNHYYKHQMIKEILRMYSDEIHKAMMNGERVQITKVCSLCPEINVHNGKYNMPSCNKTEGNPPPYAKIRISEHWAMRERMSKRLMQNIENGIWGLNKLLFTKTQFKFLKDTGYIPKNAELETNNDYTENQ